MLIIPTHSASYKPHLAQLSYTGDETVSSPQSCPKPSDAYYEAFVYIIDRKGHIYTERNREGPIKVQCFRAEIREHSLRVFLIFKFRVKLAGPMPSIIRKPGIDAYLGLGTKTSECLLLKRNAYTPNSADVRRVEMSLGTYV